jgi:HEPN domain-containing protein
MADTTITIALDEATAEAYNMASTIEQQKMQMLLRVLLREFATSSTLSLRELMDDIGEKAVARGLTPDILEQLLHDVE